MACNVNTIANAQGTVLWKQVKENGLPMQLQDRLWQKNTSVEMHPNSRAPEKKPRKQLFEHFWNSVVLYVRSAV